MKRRLSLLSTVLASMLASLSVAGAGGCALKQDPVTALIAPLIPPSPSEVALDLFNPFDADKRRRAIGYISASPFGGEDVYVRAYRTLVADRDATVRAAAIKALGLYGSVDDAELIAQQLQHPSDLVRWEAARALQKIHNPKVILPLMQALARDESSDVRMASAFALGQYPEVRVFESLVGALNDNDFGVVWSARVSLDTLTGYEFGSDGTLWLIWQKNNAGKLFEHRRQYTWKPFDDPPSLFQRMQFWKKKEPPPPRPPTGIAADTSKAGS